MAATAPTTTTAAETTKQAVFKVYIGNLDYKTTEDAVRQFISTAGGQISSVALPLKYGKRPSGFAIVSYGKEADAKNAVEKLQDGELEGRKLRVQIARTDEETAAFRSERDAERKEKKDLEKKKRQEAKEAAAAATAEQAATEEAQATGAPKKASKKSSKKRVTRRRVPGEDGEDAEETIAEATETKGEASKAAEKTKSKRKSQVKATASEARIDGQSAEDEQKPIKEKKERKPREKKMEPTGEDSKDTLFVSNLPYDIDDDALASIFTNLSIEIKSAKVITSTHNRYRGTKENIKLPPRSRGYGFVEIANPTQRDEAVEKAAGTLVASREIGVKVAKEMVPKDKVDEAPTQDPAHIQATPEKVAA